MTEPSATVSVRYIVDDVEEAVAFYTKVLDFEVLNNFAPVLADVSRAIRTGAEPRSHARLGLDVVRMIEAVDRSLALRSSVDMLSNGDNANGGDPSSNGHPNLHDGNGEGDRLSRDLIADAERWTAPRDTRSGLESR